MAVGLGREGGVGSFEVLAQQAQADAAVRGVTGQQGHRLDHELGAQLRGGLSRVFGVLGRGVCTAARAAGFSAGSAGAIGSISGGDHSKNWSLALRSASGDLASPTMWTVAPRSRSLRHR